MRAVRCVLRAERVHSPCLTIARAAPGSGAGRNPDGLLLGSRVVPQDEVRIRRGPTGPRRQERSRHHASGACGHPAPAETRLRAGLAAGSGMPRRGDGQSGAAAGRSSTCTGVVFTM
jgi:hypothetical protein